MPTILYFMLFGVLLVLIGAVFFVVNAILHGDKASECSKGVRLDTIGNWLCAFGFLIFFVTCITGEIL